MVAVVVDADAGAFMRKGHRGAGTTMRFPGRMEETRLPEDVRAGRKRCMAHGQDLARGLAPGSRVLEDVVDIVITIERLLGHQEI